MHKCLFRFLLIAKAIIRPNVDGTKRLDGLKLGYERKVLLEPDSEDYRVESQFVADQNWQTDFESFVREQVPFLSDLSTQTEEINDPDSNSLLKTLLISLSERTLEELSRIYPTLRNCLEIHVYLFINLSSNAFSLVGPEVIAAYIAILFEIRTELI